MKRPAFNFILLCLFIAFQTSCGKKKSELIVKSWKATELELAGGTKLSADDMGGISYTFHPDGSFSYTEAARTQEGKWTMNQEETVVTLAYEDDGRKVEQEIKQLTEESLVLHGTEHGMEREVSLVPAEDE